MTDLSTPTRNALKPHWLFTGSWIGLIIAYNLFCLLWSDAWRLHWDEADRIVLRSVLYAVAIVLFPLVNLLRHVLLRLNQTMPGTRTAARRYQSTVFITLGIIQCVGLFGVALFMLGDDSNTLAIFTLLAALGLYLHRPRSEELDAIHTALSQRQTASH